MPKKMRIALIHNVVFWLNNIPKAGQIYSPKDLVPGDQLLNYKIVCRIPFGAYAQVHDDQSITNTMESRTTGAISLGTTENAQGTYRFMSLRTGEIIVRHYWSELPIPLDVIDRVDELAANEPEYEDELLDTAEEDDEAQGDEAQSQINDETEQIIEEQEQGNEMNAPNEKDDQHHDHVNDEVQNNESESEEYERREEEMQQQEDGVPGQHGYNLRPDRGRDWSHRFTFLSVQAGLNQFGHQGKDAIQDELQLFLKEKVFAPVNEPTPEQKKQALCIHCFLTEKRDGRVKARAMADGRSQIRYSEEETYSPTVKLESIMLSSLIDALEHRYVATIDIKGAFLKAKVPDDMELFVKMDSDLAKAFTELDNTFQPDEHGVLYLKCLKALYGHIEAARLFYDELNYSLTERMQFTQNKYDSCVYNKHTEDGLVTIKTHVDNLKVSSKTETQIQRIIEQLREIYKEITVQIDQTHDYLGMIMEHERESGSAKINMKRYIESIIERFKEEEPHEKLKSVTTPATNNLFKT
jgi:hypothetical protein